MGDDRLLNDAIADEMLDRLALDPDLAVIRHTVQVTSFGGSGTTALHEHLASAGLDLPATPGAFPFKHQPVPPEPACVPQEFRVVYPFGDPRDAVLSIFRRGFQGGHYRGMQLRRPSVEVQQRLSSLDAFLEAGVDDFGLDADFRRWHERSPRAYPVLFVRFAELPHIWDRVRDFVGLGPAAPGLTITRRASAWSELPRSRRARLDEMYGELAARLEALPPAERS